jgi:hypothetical protein
MTVRVRISAAFGRVAPTTNLRLFESDKHHSRKRQQNEAGRSEDRWVARQGNDREQDQQPAA